MAKINWPEGINPLSVSLRNVPNVRGFKSGNGFVEPPVDLLEDHWEMSLTVDAVQGRQAGKLSAFLNRLAGGWNTVDLWHFIRPLPRGTCTASKGLLESAGKGESSVTIEAPAGSTLKPGDMLKVGDLLLQVAENCTADANGSMEVTVVNRLRKTLPAPARASTASQISSTGTLSQAPVNSLRYQYPEYVYNVFLTSDDLTTGYWGKNQVTVTTESVGGVTTASRVQSNSLANDFVQQQMTYDVGTVVTVTVRLRAGTATLSRIMFRNSITTLSFDLSWVAGVPTPTSTPAGYTTTSTPAGGGWHDLTVTGPIGEYGQNFRLYPDASSAGGHVFVAKTSCTRTSVPVPYVQTGTVPVPQVLASPTPLVEAATTNLVPFSKNLTGAGWGGGTTVSLTSEVWLGSEPFYNVIKAATTANEHRALNLPNAETGEIYTATLTVLAGSATQFHFGFYIAGSWGATTARVAVTKVSGPGSIAWHPGSTYALATGLSAREPSVFRLSRLSYGGTFQLLIYPDGAASTTSGRGIKVTGVQVEKGLGSSYVPTAGAAVTRAADVLQPVTLDKPAVPFGLLQSSGPDYSLTELNSVSITLREEVK